VVDSLLAELLDLLRQLAAQDIAAVPLKGPVMAQTLYGRAELRQAGDLDIFVAPDRVRQARAILRNRGYAFTAVRQTDAVAVKTAAAGNIAVDLQWALARRVFRFPVTLEGVWERLTSVEVRGVAVRQPEPGDYLLILCAHASKHCWSSLIWIADLVAFLQTWGGNVDWHGLLVRAALAGGERQLLLGLRLASDLFQVDLPAPVSERLRTHSALDSLVAQVREALFAPSTERSFQGTFGVIRGGVFYMRTRERIRDRIPYAVELLRQCVAWLVALVTPNHLDRAVIKLPRFLGFLYFGVRLVRVTVKWSVWLTSRDRRRLRRPARKDAGAG
jgi:hypothetical protein